MKDLGRDWGNCGEFDFLGEVGSMTARAAGGGRGGGGDGGCREEIGSIGFRPREEAQPSPFNWGELGKGFAFFLFLMVGRLLSCFVWNVIACCCRL